MARTHGAADRRSKNLAPVDPPLPGGADRVLLLNPPVYDIRFPWSRWQEPTLLLRLGSHFRGLQADVKLIDAVNRSPGERLTKKQVDKLNLGGREVLKHRFGRSHADLRSALRGLADSGWRPDEIYVECFTTFWWEGAREVIGLAKSAFPGVQVTLIGGYPLLAPDHAERESGADQIVRQPWSALAGLPPDISLHEKMPEITYVATGGGQRAAADVVAEIHDLRAGGARALAFADAGVARRFADLFTAILDELARAEGRVPFYALGNIAPGDLVARPELAGLMKRAGYEEIHFSDDRDVPMSDDATKRIAEEYRQAAELCHRAGFKARTRALTGGVCVGRHGEDLCARAELVTLVAHYIGSVIVWPYQPDQRECANLSLELQNGKVFPFRKQNGYSYREYADLLGLAAVLSAKYRDCSFDFLGDGLIARLFRDSLRRKAWEPDDEVKGPIELPVLIHL